jgi:L-rhamnose mutarotase
MTRHVLSVDLKDDPDVIARYVEHHRRVWPEVLRSLRAAGIADMEILLLGRRLVMIVETDGDVRSAFASHVASHPRVAQWEALMKSMQEPPPGGGNGEWWAPMTPIFRLGADGAAAASAARGSARPA